MMNVARLLFIGLILLVNTKTVFSGETVYSLQVDGLGCPFCAYGIEKNLNAIDGIKYIEVDLENARILVTMHQNAQLSEQQARQAVLDAGFTLGSFSRNGKGP